MEENDLRECPVCGHTVERSDMRFTIDTATEMHKKHVQKLVGMLDNAWIPYEMAEIEDWHGYQIFYPNQDDCKGDVICHDYSYGHKDGLLEAMGFDIDQKTYGDTVVGYLTAEEAFEFFKRQYEKDYQSAVRKS